MKLFEKLRNLLSDEEDDVEQMPVFSKNESNKKEEVKEEQPIDKKEVEVKQIIPTRFKNEDTFNEKQYEEDDILSEISSREIKDFDSFEPTVEEDPVEEKKSPFLTFDEDEFERLNAHIRENETKSIERQEQENKETISKRSELSTYSPTNITFDRHRNEDRYKIHNDGPKTTKKFTPSPVLSPVYGVLDKNYTKEDIIDKKDGIKREKIIKPIKKPDKLSIEEEPIEVNIDAVRKKAYGMIDSLQKNAMSRTEKKESEKVFEEIKVEEKEPKKNNNIKEEPELDKNQTIETILEKESNPKKEEPEKSQKELNELEKTNTLKILDDIEKELNDAIPPKKEHIEEQNEIEEPTEEHETLEDDLFDLIDSMYEQGEEDEND